MKPGQMMENAIWLTGMESPADRARYEADIRRSFEALAQEHNVLIGPVSWVAKQPGAERVPPVPDHVSGPDVRLLVAEAAILCRRPFIVMHGGFLGQLDPVDLARLRAITKRAYARANPDAFPLSDSLCDSTIEKLGPEAAIDAVRQAVDSQAIH